MRYPHEQARLYTKRWCKCTNSFQRSEERRKLPMTIAHAMGAVSASYQVALPVLPRRSGVTQWWSWTLNMGGCAGFCSDFSDSSVSGKSSVNVYLLVSRTTDATPQASQRDLLYVDRLTVLKSSELRFDRFYLLSLLLIHNTCLQDLERL